MFHMPKRYVIKTPGTGHSPHILENADDPEDVIALCSCGGTSDPHGFCDGTHAKKKASGCSCWYCKTQEERIAPQKS